MQAEAPEEDTMASSSQVDAVQNEPEDRAAQGFEPAPELRPTTPEWLDTGYGGGPERRFDPN
jgi:hypothetical protein